MPTNSTVSIFVHGWEEAEGLSWSGVFDDVDCFVSVEAGKDLSDDAAPDESDSLSDADEPSSDFCCCDLRRPLHLPPPQLLIKKLLLLLLELYRVRSLREGWPVGPPKSGRTQIERCGREIFSCHIILCGTEEVKRYFQKITS